MFKVNGTATIATVTDLRRSANFLLERAESGESVVVQRNAEAVGVLLGYDAYQNLLERVENLELLMLALDRERRIESGEDALVPLADLMKEFGVAPAK
ncbi:MAG TPA: type II toxin-antitoxin system Phd/YefM family antitoxin [Longimicrobium sp.]|nr:type II toxin-antitoxin system Phd/YefM family antitoxin [Longimicrobium sp.]